MRVLGLNQLEYPAERLLSRAIGIQNLDVASNLDLIMKLMLDLKYK